MDISVIREIQSLRIAVSVLLSAGILLTPRWWFLFWIPLLPYAGIWIYAPDNPRAYMFVSSYIELSLAFLFLYRFFTSQKDDMAIWLFAMVSLSLPSLYNAYYHGHFLLSLFLFLCLLSGSGLYLLYRDHMHLIDRFYLVDLSVLLWLALGIFIKFYIGARLNQPWFIQRGGGVLGSNHVAGILFLLLPFVRARLVALIAILFLIIQLSRGIYLALFVYITLWAFFINPKQAFRWMAAIAITGTAGFFLLEHLSFTSEYGLVTVKDYFVSRLKMFYGFDLQAILTGLLSDSRWDITDTAWIVGRQVSMTGIGFGGFLWGLARLGDPLLYSNAHNMFVTLLVEGGLAFTVGFAGFLVYLLIHSFRISKKIFIGLATWVFYGLYSGEIYEVGGMVTAGDYFVFLFLVAAVCYKRQRDKCSNMNFSLQRMP